MNKISNKDNVGPNKNIITIVETKNAKLPSKLLSLKIFVSPYLMPTIAANESEIVIVKSEETMRCLFSKNKKINEHPRR